MNRKLTLSVAVASATFCLSNVTVAQEQRTLALEEVIVTATKREQNLQDVAVAVTALDESMLQQARINSSEDLTFLVPSLNLQKGANPRATSYSIRGIGTQSFSSAVEPSVSTMVDGVVMGRSGQAFMQLLDIERVEVLRGPQGTLFGKNSTAGVVHIVTQNPTDEFSGQAMASAVTEGEYRGGLTVSGPLGDDIGFRLSANGSTLDDFTKNYYDSNDLNGSDEWSVRGKLRWFALPELEVKWSSDYSDRSCDCTVGALRSIEPYGGNEDDVDEILAIIDPVVPDEENKDVNVNKLPSSDWESWGHSLELNWDVGEFTVTSITAAREYNVNGFGDVDNQPIDSFGFDQYGQTDQEQFTQELRLLSPADGPITYVAGLFYFDQTVERSFRREFDINFPGVAIADFEVDTTNWAAFGEATWNISDEWRLIVGARYTEDELDFTFGRTAEGSSIGLPEPVAPTPGDTDEDDLSGKIALQWDYSDEGMTYLSYTEGYKGPAFDIAFGTNPVGLERVEPETSESWELGVKSDFFDGRLRMNAALFYSVYEEFQAQAYIDPDGIPDCEEGDEECQADDDPGAFLLINAGEVSSTGLEIDFLAQLTERLRLSGGAAYVEAEIEDYPAGQCSSGQQFRGECPGGVQDLSGGDLPFSPDWKLNLAATYTLPLQGSFDLVFRGAVRAQDDVLLSITQDENTIQDSYAIYDASVIMQSHSDEWEASFFVKNITDEFYANAIESTNSNMIPNGYVHRYDSRAERQFGMEVRYRWF